MPNCIIEITNNLLPSVDCNKFMKDVANAIKKVGCFNPDDIKVRIYPIELSFMGINFQEHSFAAVEISVLDNKTDEQLHYLNQLVHNVMLLYFKKMIGISSITTRISLIDSRFFSRSVNYKD